MQEKKSQQQSGLPGEGKGRREDVRGSGVHPASGPHPPGNAPIQPEGTWGRSPSQTGTESIRTGSQIIRPEDAKASHEQYGMEIPRDQWSSFLGELSREHQGEPVDMELTNGPDGRKIEAHDLPLLGITFEEKDITTSIILGDQPEKHVTHFLPHTNYLLFKPPEQELQIASTEGAKAILHFRGRSV